MKNSFLNRTLKGTKIYIVLTLILRYNNKSIEVDKHEYFMNSNKFYKEVKSIIIENEEF